MTAVILLLEDEPDHSELTRRGLEGAPVELVSVPDLASGRAWLATRTPDLVISDLRLPDGGALDLLVPGACPAPVVVMTSFGGEQLVVEAMRRGALDYVIKSPAMFRELPLIVERALRSARQLADKQRIELQLRETEQKFQQLAHAIQEVFYLYEIGTDELVYVSPAWTTMFGSPAESVLGPLDHRLAVIAAGERPRIGELLRGTAGTVPARIEYRAAGATGELVILERTYPLPDVEGGPWRVAGVMTDVTQRRTLEDMVRRAQGLSALGQVVGGVAHDLNNMLGTIMYAADQLGDHLADDPEGTQLCELISHAATRNSELTQQLMAFARVGAQAATPIDLNRVVWDTVTLLRRSLDRRAFAVADLRASPSIVLGDLNQLQSALLHLGLQTRDVGGEIAFETDNVVLDETACATLPFEVTAGPYLQIAMYATALDAEMLRARIFDPLSLADPATHLGLGAVYGIVVAHRGALAVYGAPERGSVVKIYLPLARDTRLAAVDSSSEPPRGSGAVLVADDEPLVADALARVLTGLGYSVTIARDGEEALTKLRAAATPYAAIICDLMMPKQHGPDLLAQILEIAPASPLIASSGFLRDQHVASLSTLGIAAYLPKPVRRAELAAVLAAAIRARG